MSDSLVLVQVEQYTEAVLFRVDPSSPLALFEQLAASVRSGVGRGEVVAGERLPSAREVADALDVNVHTVLRAYQALREEGLVDLRRGRGAVVTDRAATYSQVGLAIPALVAEARKQGITAAALIALVREEYSS